ncbi:hypothetical protein BMT55_13895 [Listeria newyorkensis]|uniref:Single-stranded DNA-binding protein n=1 Tax=Listeria newyorkensis TaxID=1497681 RepID=A0ABX4XL52_9LIST|nr:single-stranded DNA-binding protein [Listeria newyorkensis]KGL45722.1 hypothetical protein EP58_03250 [Listeria newyorkensis]PNP88959.1 hypothetical protein BMT55_13895 [Listeria newyorkensis]SQC55345.1 Helix-destabilizing protein [Listeria newyorkensis]
MADVNTIVASGNLTADPELRYTQNGLAVANATIACNGIPRDGVTPVIFLKIVAWKGTAESLANFARKGQNITVTGSLVDASYTGQDGNKVNKVEVNVMFLKLPPKNSQEAPQQQSNVNQSNHQPNPQNSRQQGNSDPFSTGTPIDISDDDLPF